MSISIDRKTSRILELTITDGNGPIDLSKVSIEWRLFGNDGVLIEKAIPNGIEITNASEGNAEVILEDKDTDIPPGDYVYELVVEDVEGHSYIPKKDMLTISDNRTSEV